MPSADPSAVPRRIGADMRLKSSLVGIRPVTFFTITERVDSCSRLAMISPMPNMPMATITKPMPSASSGKPKVKRAEPEFTSVPTMPSSRPSTIMPSACRSEPCASTIEATRPSTISEKYSARTELQGDLRQRRGEQRDQDRRDRAGEEGADGGRGEREAGMPGAPSGSRRAP